MATLKTILGINIAFFSIIGLLHLLRLFFQWPAQIGTWTIPVWLSGLGLVIAVVLVYLNSKNLH